MRKILIAGVYPQVGSSFIQKMLQDEDVEIIGLTEGTQDFHHPRLLWKKCDLFSLKDVVMGLEGQEEAYYLGKSVSLAALNQGARKDYELLMADNFLRAASHSEIKKIWIPETMSDELKGLFFRSEIPTLLIEKSLLSSKAYSPLEREGTMVRSIQRLPLPPGKNAQWLMDEYFRWLPVFCSSIVKVKVDKDLVTFSLFDPNFKILVLKRSQERSGPDRQLLYVVGGLLAGKMERGRLEFREILNGKYVLAALHEFRPALPWFIYLFTQAIVHLIVMKAFEEHLKWCVISDRVNI